MRVSELTGLCQRDVQLTGAHIQTNGKGRKQRTTLLTAKARRHAPRVPALADRSRTTSCVTLAIRVAIGTVGTY